MCYCLIRIFTFNKWQTNNAHKNESSLPKQQQKLFLKKIIIENATEEWINLPCNWYPEIPSTRECRWNHKQRGTGSYTLKVPETLSLAVRTAASRSNPSTGSELSWEAAYAFQSASSDGEDLGCSPLLGPPVNHDWAVFCILRIRNQTGVDVGSSSQNQDQQMKETCFFSTVAPIWPRRRRIWATLVVLPPHLPQLMFRLWAVSFSSFLAQVSLLQADKIWN